MTSHHSTINVETKSERVNKMIKLHSIHLKILLQYITLIYHLLYCKEHIQIMNNDSAINVETKNNTINK